jgi:hypothetical protein
MPATEKPLEGQTPQQSPAPGGSLSPGYIANLALGDLLVFLLFAFFGLTSHRELNGAALLPQVVWVALPFMLSWFIVGPPLGVYRRKLERNTRAMTLYTLRAWVVAWPLAMALRWLLVERVHPVAAGDFLAFSLVAFFMVLTLLLVWRWPYAWYRGARARGGH